MAKSPTASLPVDDISPNADHRTDLTVAGRNPGNPTPTEVRKSNGGAGLLSRVPGAREVIESLGGNVVVRF